MKNQDTSWYWSQKKFHFKTCLGIGLEIKLISRQVLVLVLNKKGGLAELCTKVNKSKQKLTKTNKSSQKLIKVNKSLES